ncbi:MAG: hypothetical protein ACREN7_06970 [Candidatus Dormibacteria bacterium]
MNALQTTAKVTAGAAVAADVVSGASSAASVFIVDAPVTLTVALGAAITAEVLDGVSCGANIELEVLSHGSGLGTFASCAGLAVGGIGLGVSAAFREATVGVQAAVGAVSAAHSLISDAINTVTSWL